MEKTITVINPLGLHARPAAKVVDCAARFTSDIRLSYQDQDIDAKSIMSVLMLAAPCGAELSVAINGDDENDAMTALEALFASGFDELE
jgi:phosphocarrier protein